MENINTKNIFGKKTVLWISVAVIVLELALFFIYSKKNQHVSEVQNTSNQIAGSSLEFQIKNYAYDVSLEGLYFGKGMFGPKDSNYNPRALKLTDGTYSWGPDHNVFQSGCTSDTMHLASIAQDSNHQPLYALGDLNGDSKDDAVVILNLEYKEYGTGSKDSCTCLPEDFSTLLLITLVNNNGQLEQTDSARVSDVSKISVDNGIITVTGKNIEYYKLVSGKLVIPGNSFQKPTLPANLKTYNNDDFGFSFQYPDDLNFDIQKVQPPTLFKMEMSPANIQGSALTISVNAESYASCVSTGLTGSKEREYAKEIMINGIPFYKTAGGDGAAGTYRTEVQYTTFNNEKCYRIWLQYFTHQCQNYLPFESGDTQQAQAYNDCLANNKSAEALLNIADIIVSTFALN